MTGYLDRTWCPEDISRRCRRSEGCYRVITPEDRINAEKWWGNSRYPISVFAKEPECFTPFSQHKTNGEK